MAPSLHAVLRLLLVFSCSVQADCISSNLTTSPPAIIRKPMTSPLPSPSASPSPSPSPRRLHAIAIKVCTRAYQACPVRGWLGQMECVDVMTNALQCGGCTSTRHGVNCYAEEGVKVATCNEGKCEPSECMSGWHFSPAVNGEGPSTSRCTVSVQPTLRLPKNLEFPGDSDHAWEVQVGGEGDGMKRQIQFNS